MLEDQSTAALDAAESQIAQLSDSIATERAAYQRSLDEQWSELTGKLATVLEEQHAWYLTQLSAFERDRDGAVEELTATAKDVGDALPSEEGTPELPAMPEIDCLDPVSKEAMSKRCNWVLNNPDIVVMLHAIRVELLVRYVMPYIVTPDEANPFQLSSTGCASSSDKVAIHTRMVLPM